MAFSAKWLESCGKAVAWGLSEASTRASNGRCALDLGADTSPTSRVTSTRPLGVWACPRSRGGTRPPSRHHKFARQGPTAAGPRQSSPSSGPPAAFPRKNSPSTPQTTVFGPFFVRWANFFALASTTRPRRANFFAHRTRRRGDIETNDASATADAGQHETAVTTARP